jgi:hypothetical protein
MGSGLRGFTLRYAYEVRSEAEYFATIPEMTLPDEMLRMPAATISLQEVREWARRAEQANDLPISVAEKFTSGSRFMGELSPRMGGEEKRRSIPWRPFHRWLDRVSSIEMLGSMPSSPIRYSLPG